jgi:hypothetical protein
MGFALFPYNDNVEKIVRGTGSSSAKMEDLHNAIGDDAFPTFIRRFVTLMSDNVDSAVSFQGTAGVYPSMTADEKKLIARSRGMMGASQLGGSQNAKHFFKIFKNDVGMARLYYKFGGSIRFSRQQK